uniref:Uncharacterized protein n=1 Tax=Eptatretus burgeri TaxID=7764 RepID=A0A8C4Q8Z0_EPTBU
MLKEISAQPVQIDEHGLRLRLSPLIASVSRHARAWISSLSQLLETSAKQQLSSIVTQIQTLSENIKQSPDSLERLRFLLVTIAEIRSLSICVESRILDIQERYRILAMHGLQATLEDTNCVETLMTSWKEVVQEARDVDLNLHSAKKQFKQQMVKETEECRAAIEDLAEQCSAHGPACVGEDLDKGLELLVEYEEAVKMQEEKLKEFANTERLLGLSTSFHPALQKLQADLHDYRQVYDIYSSHKNEVAEWSRMRWRDLKVQTLETALEKHLGDVHALPVSAHALPTVPHLERKLKAFRKSIPPLRDLKQECLRERHWQELMEKSGRSFKINPETFTLEDIFSMELHKYSDIIGEVVDSAAKEFSIEKGIQEVVDTWEGMEFTVLQFLNGKRDCGFILGGTDSILQNLDDSSMLLQSMMGSQHIGPFFITVQAWEKTLSLINEVIEVWLLVQRKWMYLENVFTGGDLRAQLPDEAGRFDDIDGCFKKIMVDTMKNPLIKSHCQEQGRLSELRALNQGLEICQKRLSTYLDSKRNVFPRFFFLSDDDLLNILCKKDPEGLQEHIVKMFDNVASLRLIENAGNFEGMVVTAMVSTEGEEMPFIKVVPTDGPVEEWMTAVSQEMYRSNHQLIKHAVYTYCQETSRVDWILLYQATVILAACQVWWTWEVEDAFRQLQTGDKTAMKDVMKQIHVQIDALVGRVGGSLSPNDYSKLNMVLIIDVHARDIVDGFVRDSVMDGRQFAWESQLRFYWEREQNSLKIHQCTGIFTYGHEYMGLNGRLVITPLTDRIFLTLTQALSMHLGGAPSGPAGTGKTETVKDLAKALGQLCVVTNCSEGMDFNGHRKGIIWPGTEWSLGLF